jgi:hypothetical protein
MASVLAFWEVAGKGPYHLRHLLAILDVHLDNREDDDTREWGLKGRDHVQLDHHGGEPEPLGMCVRRCVLAGSSSGACP